MIAFKFSFKYIFGRFSPSAIDVYYLALSFIIDGYKRLDILFPLFLFDQLPESRFLFHHKKKALLFNRGHHEMHS
jgi:hypothetical protein